MTSGTSAKKISIKSLLLLLNHALQVMLLLGFILKSYEFIAVSTFLLLMAIGMLSPRMIGIIFDLIPSEKMGGIDSALTAFTILIPSLLSVGLVYIVTHFGFIGVSIGLIVLIIISVILLLSMKFNFYLPGSEK